MLENNKNLLPKSALTTVSSSVVSKEKQAIKEPILDVEEKNSAEVQSLHIAEVSIIEKPSLHVSEKETVEEQDLNNLNKDKFLEKTRGTIALNVANSFTKLQSSLSNTQKIMSFLVVFPTLLVLFYNLLIASPIYISDTKFSIQNADTNTSFSMASIFLTGSTSTLNDSYIILEYIRSLSLIEKVDREIGFYKHYASNENDPYFRLSSDATKSELLAYWNWAIIPTLDTDTGIINLEIKAFNPQMAQKISLFVLEASEQLVNDMNERSHKDSLFLAHEEVDRAENRVKTAQINMRDFRDTHIILDPIATASGLHSLVVQLESEYVQLSTRLNEARSFMQENSPTVKNLQTSMNAVQKQLKEEKKRLAGNSFQNKNMTAVVGDYEDLTLEAGFAQEQLILAMTSLETARIQQVAQVRYLIPIQPPILADESLYPKPFLFALYTFFGLLLSLALVSLILAAIREHAGF